MATLSGCQVWDNNPFGPKSLMISAMEILESGWDRAIRRDRSPPVAFRRLRLLRQRSEQVKHLRPKRSFPLLFRHWEGAPANRADLGGAIWREWHSGCCLMFGGSPSRSTKATRPRSTQAKQGPEPPANTRRAASGKPQSAWSAPLPRSVIEAPTGKSGTSAIKVVPASYRPCAWPWRSSPQTTDKMRRGISSGGSGGFSGRGAMPIGLFIGVSRGEWISVALGPRLNPSSTISNSSIGVPSSPSRSEVRGPFASSALASTTAFSTGKAFKSRFSEAISHPAQAQNHGSWRNNCKASSCVDVYASWCSACKKHPLSTPLPAQAEICRSRELRCFRCLQIGSTAKIRSNRPQAWLSNFFAATNPDRSPHHHCLQQARSWSATIATTQTNQPTNKSLDAANLKGKIKSINLLSINQSRFFAMVMLKPFIPAQSQRALNRQ